MTLMLWMGFTAILNEKVGELGLHSAQAGWEYNETARPAKKKSLYPRTSAPTPSTEEISDEQNATAPSSRVQVFGKSSADVSAEDYAQMLKEDQAQNGDPGTDAEFDSLRARLRTRRVAENSPQTQADDVPAAAPQKRTAVRAAPAYTPPAPPPMETEVITPQKASGKKVRSGKASAPAIEPEAPRGDEVNAAFPFTHLLPSPLNIPRGSYVFGTSVAYGVFDSFEISTNVARTIQQQWNFRAKVPLVEYPTFIGSAYVDYLTFNANHFDESNPDEWTKRWQPGLVTGYEITPDIAFFLGGNFSFGKSTRPIMTTSGYLQGAAANMEWSWLYNPSTSRLGNNAISVGLKYDFTYSMFGFGFTHHWKAFDLGVHYTFADRSRFLPIFGFNVGANF